MRFKRCFAAFLLFGMIILAGHIAASGAIPHLVNYQGKLTDHAGDPVADGPYNSCFKIYGSESGTDSLWWECHSSVQVTNGIFSVILGAVNALDLSFDSPYWLEVKVGGETITPRRQLTSIGYSFRAQTADTAESIVDDAVTSAKIQDETIQFADIGQNGASENQVMKWSGGAWVAADGAGGGSNWVVVDSVLYTNNYWGIARGGAGNALYGNGAHTMVNLGVACTTGTSGQNPYYSTVSGGYGNTASARYSTIAGGQGNNISSGLTYANTIGGGEDNNISSDGDENTIGGGVRNSIKGGSNTIGGGKDNSISGPNDWSTIGGGEVNSISGDWGTIGGGEDNVVSGNDATIGGGWGNSAEGNSSTVGGGDDNSATGFRSTVSGGSYNTASGKESTVGGGLNNTASAECSVVPGGCGSKALGNHSFAAGSRAIANHEGTFVWADASSDELESTAPNQFLIRASGGIKIYSDADQTAGVTIHAGASAWAVNSDRNLKENFTPVDGQLLLRKIAALPITEWNYKTQSENVKHIGPVAQDFYAIFGLGDDNVTISTIDPTGIALAGIKELINENREMKKLIEKLKLDLEELKSR